MNDPAALTNREIAVVAWSVAILLWLVILKNVGPSIVSVLRAAMHPKLLIPVLLFGAWVAIALWGANRVGGWNEALLKDTIIWAGAGLALFGRFIRVGEPGFIRRTLVATIAVPELIGFMLGIVAFALWLEFLLVPFVVVLFLLSAVAAADPDARIVKSVSDLTLGVIGLLLVAGTAIQIALSMSEIDWHHQVLAFYLPLWLTAWSIPFVYALGVYSHYENAFVRVDFGTDDWRARRRAKTALVLGFGIRVRQLDEFVRMRLYEFLRARDLAESRSLVRDWLRRARGEPIADDSDFEG